MNARSFIQQKIENHEKAKLEKAGESREPIYIEEYSEDHPLSFALFFAASSRFLNNEWRFLAVSFASCLFADFCRSE